MKMFRLLLILPLVALSACSTVTTHVVEFNATQKYPPTSQVDVLLQKPDRPYTEIALIESRGESEAQLLNDAREKARQIGADAILRTEMLSEFYPPMPVYDPWYDPWWGYRYRAFGPLYPYPYGTYRVVGGYYMYVLKAVAIKYTDGGPAK